MTKRIFRSGDMERCKVVKVLKNAQKTACIFVGH